MIILSKFRFKTNKKEKINLIKDTNEILNTELIGGAHIEIHSNKKIIIEGCCGIVEYQNNYIKLKFKKGFISLTGDNFLILSFDNETISIKGDILAIEFCM